MDADASCPFCRIVSGRAPAHVLYADDAAVAFLDRAPLAEGHTLVVPRRHSRDLLDVDPVDAGALMASATRVARLLEDALGPDGMTLVQTNRAAGWQSSFHLHVHLVPRWEGDGLVLPGRPERTSREALAATRARILGRPRPPGVAP